MSYKIDSEIQAVKQRFEIIGNAQKLNNAIRVAIQVAPTDMSVLITGESGAGKESFSKIIHSLSHRKHGQFIAINCGAIPEGTIDSELFGHEKGAFTGATGDRKGYFEVTDGGTIFLDEIGEMPPGTQARLLRVLENGEFIKVGSSKVQKTNVRVIAATNVNLLEAVGKGKFREDLYYRLSTVPIYVPPLRERNSDVILLFKKFAYDFAEHYKTDPIKLTPEAEEYLKSHRFPGNIRQLKNIVEQISLLSPEREIAVDQLQRYLPRTGSNLPALVSNGESREDFSERDILYKVLFDMKADMAELKKLVFKMLEGNDSENEILEDHKQLFQNIETPYNQLSEYHLEAHEESEPRVIIANEEEHYDADVEDITHETASDESLSLERKEKELIIRALKKNNNKRKYAAEDLGISERTLYRKIKQYELEKL
ncbi:MAG: sigma-54-dependent Fis family transcriptional regulator [Ekhidna sp.]|nr:sigma-54-dependent Fis family transcriptional regulator [Ekhidna sp.]MBC6409303.1 sigma-54-dependent Fis family transcriptional regulator [Ekhidna sp.]MBC6426206.1 sigma-54-dependent Fis family transcriptional regulator [Ekhidna sp.]